MAIKVFFDKNRGQFYARIAGATIYDDESINLYAMINRAGHQAKTHKSASKEKGSW